MKISIKIAESFKLFLMMSNAKNKYDKYDRYKIVNLYSSTYTLCTRISLFHSAFPYY